MTFLTETDQVLKLTTSTSSAIAWAASWIDHTTGVAPGSDTGSIASATTTTVVSAPSASTSRQVVHASFANAGAVANTVTVLKGDGGNDRQLLRAVLGPNESLLFTQSDGWHVVDEAGRRKAINADRASGLGGQPVAFYKPGTAADTVGYWYCYAKDAGFPGAWSPGTPGLAGRATDGTASPDAGCIPIRNPASGANYLSMCSLTATVAHWFQVVDVLWVNSGIVVTTTTAQTINSVAFPARCADGTADGEGLMIGLLFTAASTNAAVINNSTVSYTNSGGTAGRTATLANLVGAQIPATPVIGTIVWYQLAAGDKGVRSIQSITLGTSLVTGSVSLLVARPLWGQSMVVPNVGVPPLPPLDPGVRLYNGTTALLCHQASATTATTASGTLVITER